jgi:hypothetical protein
MLLGRYRMLSLRYRIEELRWRGMESVDPDENGTMEDASDEPFAGGQSQR